MSFPVASCDLTRVGKRGTCADTAALDRDREKDCCHSLQRHSRCDAAGARTTFDGPKTLSPSLQPWLADTASAVRSSYLFSFRFFAAASTSFLLVIRPSPLSAPTLE